MRKLTGLLTPVLLALGLMASITVLNVGVASAAAKGTDRPYHDRGSATFDISTLSISGTRTATHLGTSTWTAGNVQLVSITDGFVGLTYDDTITAANGDTITTTADATIDINGGLAAPLPFSAVETITGGTGRFALASGSFTVTGLVDVTTFVLTFTSAGSISY